jgi:hypothetical protein
MILYSLFRPIRESFFDVPRKANKETKDICEKEYIESCLQRGFGF